MINNKHELFEDSLGDFMAISKGDQIRIHFFIQIKKIIPHIIEVIRMMKFMYL